MAGSFLSVMNISHRVTGADDRLVRLLDVEMEYARLFVIDPNDGVEMSGHRVFLSTLAYDSREPEGLTGNREEMPWIPD